MRRVCLTVTVLPTMAILALVPGLLWAQPVQHGAQPNPQEVRPGSPQGDSPSASAGQVKPQPEPRWLGVPRHLAVTVAVILLALLGIAGTLFERRLRRRNPFRRGP